MKVNAARRLAITNLRGEGQDIPIGFAFAVLSSRRLGNDLHILKGDGPTCKPCRVLGHDVIGVVDSVGHGVKHRNWGPCGTLRRCSVIRGFRRSMSAAIPACSDGNKNSGIVFGAPCQFQSLAGQEHGRTIPITGHRCTSKNDRGCV